MMSCCTYWHIKHFIYQNRKPPLRNTMIAI